MDTKDTLLVAIADINGNVGIYQGRDADDNDSIVGNEIQLIGVLDSVTIGNLTVDNFTNA